MGILGIFSSIAVVAAVILAAAQGLWVLTAGTELLASSRTTRSGGLTL